MLRRDDEATRWQSSRTTPVLERPPNEKGSIFVDSKGLPPSVSSVVPIRGLSPISVCMVPVDVGALIPPRRGNSCRLDQSATVDSGALDVVPERRIWSMAF